MSLVEPSVQTDSHAAAPSAHPLVLIIDDETVGIEVRRMLLERAGYRVLTAIDGSTGIELFAAQPVEAVVLDFSMPGMNGGEVARTLRSIKPAVPILMLSAYTSLPVEVASLVNLSMTKGEGAPALLKKLGSLLTPVSSGLQHASESR
jgi:CheY-like chemotaxis protein